ncbi:hypothetical protein [Streptacidiphilus jiangxiensis]|uniref:Uncharacterized protein n=1 Tax=Streptacidiphilus jiangxiensis TaxID=235985 RepID=A0A1H7T516_STRJI|nr:hypothetical protein [Streptacidiphilus jiangxiensis]SEL79404.1 hypothetical protein SAMN05414137_11356 [Streptacidiphilus jiangxiensis]
MNVRTTARKSRARRNAWIAAGVASAAALIGPAATASVAATPASGSSAPGPILNVQKVAQAPVDDCFASIGGAHPVPSANGTCPTGYQPKIDGNYVWSAARSGDYGYYGTLSNLTCGASFWDGDTTPETVPGAQVCEFGKGPAASTLGAEYGDTRIPRVLRVNADTQKVEDITPTGDPILQRTLGLRAAASNNDVVLFFGQLVGDTSQNLNSGLAAFAFEGSTGKFLGSHAFSNIVSARNGVVASDGNLYVAARQAGGLGGEVLKWTGNKTNPFQFDTVGTLPNDAGYLATFGNHLVVSGWGTQPAGQNGAVVGGPSKIWMSPAIPSTGLTTADAGSWNSIFSWDQYDPDPAVAKGIDFGGIQEWNGDLYVGSYNPAALGAVETLWKTYGQPSGDVAKMRDMTGANRAVTIFRIHAPGTAQQTTTLLYGEKTLPVYDPTTKTWGNKPNLLGQTPKFGPSGFNGNPGNAYAWTFTVFQNKLYMATFDETGLISPSAPFTKTDIGFTSTTEQLLQNVVGPSLKATLGGGDVWRMDDPNQPAVAETLNGFGDSSEHGVRVFLPFEDKGELYAGLASAYNLDSSTVNRGGWVLDRLTPGAMRPPLFTGLPADAAKAAFAGAAVAG